MFSPYIKEARQIMSESGLDKRGRVVEADPDAKPWPRDEMQIILSKDTSIELGSSDMASISLVLLTNDNSLVEDGKMTFIGPDLPECAGRSLPFGKIIFVSGHGFDEDNMYKRYEEMSLQRFSLDLAGFQPRSIPQANREWSRVSKKALAEGFSLEVLGNEQYRELQKLDYVDSVEMIIITSSAADVTLFKSLSDRAAKAAQAMNKMAEHLIYDCKDCDYKDVCDEVDGLRRMHEQSMR